MRYFIFAAVLMLVGVAPRLSAQVTETYSDVREVEESGDIVGTELVLTRVGADVTATLRYFEGTEPAPIAMRGHLSNGVLTLAGVFSNGKVRVDARVEDGRVRGRLSFELEGQTNDVELNLP